MTVFVLPPRRLHSEASDPSIRKGNPGCRFSSYHVAQQTGELTTVIARRPQSETPTAGQEDPASEENRVLLMRSKERDSVHSPGARRQVPTSEATPPSGQHVVQRFLKRVSKGWYKRPSGLTGSPTGRRTPRLHSFLSRSLSLSRFPPGLLFSLRAPGSPLSPFSLHSGVGLRLGEARRSGGCPLALLRTRTAPACTRSRRLARSFARSSSGT